jgi:hypothetical protein
MKNMSFILIITLLIGGIGYLAFRSFSTPEIKGEQKNTIITLVKINPIKNGFSGEYTFYCGSIKTEVQGAVISKAVCGDKYKAKYDSLNCHNIEILFACPVFFNTERTNVTTGEIYEIAPFFLKPYVKFKYMIEGNVYDRFQRLEKGVKEKYPEIEKGAKFPIKYWIENPQRSIMYFEKE